MSLADKFYQEYILKHLKRKNIRLAFIVIEHGGKLEKLKIWFKKLLKN